METRVTRSPLGFMHYIERNSFQHYRAVYLIGELHACLRGTLLQCALFRSGYRGRCDGYDLRGKSVRRSRWLEIDAWLWLVAVFNLCQLQPRVI